MKYNYITATKNEFDRIFEIMDSSFPDSEMRTYEDQYRVFTQNPYYHAECLADENGRIMAFMVVWDLGEFIFLENFAVDEAMRGQGLGSVLIEHVIEKYGKDVILEVEPPVDDYTRNRVHFYEKNGFIYNEFDYAMPPLHEGDDYLPLKIMSYKKRFTRDGFENYKEKIYKIAYEVKNMPSL